MTQQERAQRLGMSERMLRRYERRGCPTDFEGARTWLKRNVLRQTEEPPKDGFHAAGLSDALNSGLLWWFAAGCHRRGVSEEDCGKDIDLMILTARLILPELTGGELQLSANFERWRAAPYTRAAKPGGQTIAQLLSEESK